MSQCKQSIFVSVDNDDGGGDVVIDVRIDKEHKLYGLSKTGACAAGRRIFEKCGEDVRIMFSSSVDFPQDYAPRFRGDLRKWIVAGFDKALRKSRQPFCNVLGRIIEILSRPDIAKEFKGQAEKEFNTVLDRFKHTHAALKA